MLARYFLQRLCKDTNNSGEFEYPTDSLVEEMTTSLNAVIVRYGGFNRGMVESQICWDVSFVEVQKFRRIVPSKCR